LPLIDKRHYFQDDAKDSEIHEDDPWAGLPYTVDLETGKPFSIAINFT